MTLRQEGTAGRLFIWKKLLSYETYGVGVFLQSISSVESREGGWLKVVFVAVEILPVGSKPPAAVVVRIFKDGRHDLGAAAPFSATTSSLQERAGGSAFTPKLVEFFGPS